MPRLSKENALSTVCVNRACLGIADVFALGMNYGAMRNFLVFNGKRINHAVIRH